MSNPVALNPDAPGVGKQMMLDWLRIHFPKRAISGSLQKSDIAKIVREMQPHSKSIHLQQFRALWKDEPIETCYSWCTNYLSSSQISIFKAQKPVPGTLSRHTIRFSHCYSEIRHRRISIGYWRWRSWVARPAIGSSGNSTFENALKPCFSAASYFGKEITIFWNHNQRNESQKVFKSNRLILEIHACSMLTDFTL